MNIDVLNKIQELAKLKEINSLNEVLDWLSTYTSLLFSQSVSEVTDSELIEAIDYAIEKSKLKDKGEFNCFSKLKLKSFEEYKENKHGDEVEYELSIGSNYIDGYCGKEKNDHVIKVEIYECNTDDFTCFPMSIGQAKELSQFLNNIVDLVEGTEKVEVKVPEKMKTYEELIVVKLAELFELNSSVYKSFNSLCEYMLKEIMSKPFCGVEVFGHNGISDEYFYQMLCDYVKEKSWEDG